MGFGVLGVATASASVFGTWQLVDPIQRPSHFTVRITHRGAYCRALARTRHSCYTIRKGSMGELVDSGRVGVSGHRVSFSDGATGECPGRTGRYTWRRVKRGIRLHGLQDLCAGRRHLFVAGTWKRK
jgi:hypothetical protein